MQVDWGLMTMLCTRVVEMDMGKLVYSGFTGEMKTRELTNNVR